jgi:RNA polymerase sigma-70 factor (ECF subfamily)
VPPGPATSQFEPVVLAHLDAAYNLARWMVRSDHDAQDVVQEACLRAFRAFDTFRGSDARCWLLVIVRNTCLSWMERNRRRDPAPLTDYDLDHLTANDADDPQRLAARAADAADVRAAIAELPPEFKEAVILRDIEGLSYKEIADVVGVPIGTVMSRLARARKRLAERLAPWTLEEV